MTATVEDTRQALKIVQAVAETIREVKECPSGTVYAALMGRISLNTYEKIITTLKHAGCIEETPSHLLRWIAQ